MLTANGEVHTNEEAQVCVRDLNLFVAVQLLEETPGKLCEDHGDSHEWVSGQKSWLTKEVNTIVCKTDNLVPLVVPGLSTSSGSNSSSTSTSQDLSSANPAQERSDGPASREWCGSSKTHNKNKKRMAVEMRTTVCKIFLNGWRSSQIIWRTELHAPAHISQDSDSARPTKVVSKSRKHGFFSLPKRPKLRSLLANQNDKDSLQKTQRRSRTSC